jgi:hypothetical protein
VAPDGRRCRTETLTWVEPERVLPHALRLAARGDLAGGLLCCALIERCSWGWPESWRDLLDRLRAHPQPDVAYRAHEIYTTYG